MKRLFVWFACMLVAAIALQAGPIYGTLRLNGRGINARIDIVPAGGRPIAIGTGPDGSYHATVPVNGRCQFRVTYENISVATDIFSYADPIKYDFDLIPQGKGFALQRR